MKKTRISKLCVAVLVFSVLCGCSNLGKNNQIQNAYSDKEIVDIYANAVKNSKNSTDFNLEITTSLKLESISSSANLLKDMLESVMGYKVGDIKESESSCRFSNGADSADASKTPLNVIQPAGAYIDNFNVSAVTVNYAETDGETMLSLKIAKESENLDTVMNAVRPVLNGQDNYDKTAVNNLAPNHSDFIDVGDILSTSVDILGIGALMGSGSGETSGKPSANRPIKIMNGVCSVDDTEIQAMINENGLLESVSVTAPVELNANIEFMGNLVNTTIRVIVFQNYAFGNYKQ